MSSAGQLEILMQLFDSGIINTIEMKFLLNGDNYYGPSVKVDKKSYFLINNRWLTKKEYKKLVFDKDMKELLS